MFCLVFWFFYTFRLTSHQVKVLDSEQQGFGIRRGTVTPCFQASGSEMAAECRTFVRASSPHGECSFES